MKNAIILVCLLFSAFAGFSQVGIGTKNPDTTSVLDLSSTTKGLLIPRMTTAQRNPNSEVTELTALERAAVSGGRIYWESEEALQAAPPKPPGILSADHNI